MRVSRARSNCKARSFPTTIWWISTPPGTWSQEFARPAAAIIKHTNPCGCAEQESLAESYRKAFECDPVSAYGGVLAFNRAAGRRDRAGSGEDFHRSDRGPGYDAEALAVLGGEEESAALEGRQRGTMAW